MKNIVNCCVRSIPLSLLIIAVSYFVAHFIFDDPQKLDFTLFALGAIPIIFFLPSLFSQSKSGALHTPKVIFRKVENLEKREKREKESYMPALSYVLAGLIAWAFGYLVF